MAQGDESNAKDDTRFYAVGASVTACVTDLSHQADNITAGTSSAWEASGTRWDFTTRPWCVDLVVTCSSTQNGYLYSRETGGNGIRLSIAAGPIVEARVDGTLVASVTVTGITTAEGLAVSWSMEANPLTTGAGDAVASYLHVINTTDSTFFSARELHAAPTAAPTAAAAIAIWGAQTAAGASRFTGTITLCRWSVGRVHPAAESREDLVGLTAAPTLAFSSRLERPVPTRASGIGAAGYFAGPVWQFAARALKEVDLRQASGVMQLLPRSAPTLSNAPAAVRSWASPDGDGYVFFGQYLAHVPLPLPVNRLQVRVQLQCWRVDADPPDYVRVRCYSMNRPPGPGVVGNAPQAWTRFFVTESALVDDGSGTTGGAWYSFDPLLCARDKSGRGTWLALAFLVEDDGGGGVADQRWRVRSWTVEPGIIDSAGALPLGGIG